MQQSKDSSSDAALKWLGKLSRHFKTELSEDELEIYVQGLRKATSYQLDEGFERCLNECLFMPKLTEIHERIPSQKWPPENPGRFIQQQPITDMIRPIAVSICKGMTGREYDQLDARNDAELIQQVFTEASRTRYRNMGLNPDNWNGRARS